MIEKIKTEELIISESKYPELRYLIGELASDPQYDLEGLFNWFNEDNTGAIQIIGTPVTLGAFEEVVDNLEEDEEFSDEEIELLKTLLNNLLSYGNNVTVIYE